MKIIKLLVRDAKHLLNKDKIIMIVNLKGILDIYYPHLFGHNSDYCNLVSQDPEFNSGKGVIFFKAFQRAIDRRDFRNEIKTERSY